MNEEMTIQARIRRLQDTLIVVGTGVIAFGAWSLMKTTLFVLLFDDEEVHQLFQLSADTTMETIYIVFVLVAIIDTAIRLYIGLSARAEGHGKRKRIIYLFIGAFMAVLSASNIILIMLGNSTSPTVLDMIMTLVIEATSFLTLVLMIFCSVRLRRLNRDAE